MNKQAPVSDFIRAKTTSGGDVWINKRNIVKYEIRDEYCIIEVFDGQKVIKYQTVNPKKDFSKRVYTEQDKVVIETLLCILACLDSVTIQHVVDFCDTLKATEDYSSMCKLGLSEPFLMNDGKARSMNNRLRKLVAIFNNDLSFLSSGTGNINFQNNLANAMDYTERAIGETVMFIERYTNRTTSAKTLRTPKDPLLLSKLIRSLIFCDLSANVYDHITSKSNYPIVHECEGYRFLRMNMIYKQLVKILSYLRFEDVHDNELKFNISGLIHSKDCEEACGDILRILYSAEYIDKLLKEITGTDYQFSNAGIRSLVLSFESTTYSLSYYDEKYKNKLQ